MAKGFAADFRIPRYGALPGGGLAPVPFLLGSIFSVDAGRRITLNGGRVADWADQYGRPLSWASATNQPTYVADAGDGRPSVSFVAGDQSRLDHGANIITLGTPSTWSISGVVRVPAPTVDVWLLQLQNGAAPTTLNGMYMRWIVTATDIIMTFGLQNDGGTLNTSGSVAVPQQTGPRWLAFLYRSPGVSPGSLRATILPPTGVTIPASPITTTRARLGGLYNGPAFYTGQWAALDFYPTTISNAQWTGELLPYYQARFPRIL